MGVSPSRSRRHLEAFRVTMLRGYGEGRLGPRVGFGPVPPDASGSGISPAARFKSARPPAPGCSPGRGYLDTAESASSPSPFLRGSGVPRPFAFDGVFRSGEGHGPPTPTTLRSRLWARRKPPVPGSPVRVHQFGSSQRGHWISPPPGGSPGCRGHPSRLNPILPVEIYKITPLSLCQLECSGSPSRCAAARPPGVGLP